MHAVRIATAAALIVVSSVASAGLPTTADQRALVAQAKPQAPAVRETAINPLTKGDISGIEGAIVYGEDDGKLGYVSTALIDPQTKKIDRLVVTAGGVLGIGGHRVAIPVDQFTWETDKGGFRLMQTIASLRAMPEWIEEGGTATGSSQPPPSDKSSIGGNRTKTSR